MLCYVKTLFHEGKSHYSQGLKNLWPSGKLTLVIQRNTGNIKLN